MNKIKQAIHNSTLMLKYIYKSDKLIFLLKALSIVFSAGYAYVGTMYLKWLVDFIASAEYSKMNISRFIALVFLIQFFSLFLYSIQLLFSRIIIPRREYCVKNKLQNMFINKAMHQDLSRYEDWEFYDTYTKTVRYADTKAFDIFHAVFSFVESIVNILVMVSIIVQLDKFVLVIVVCMIVVSMFDQKLSNKYSYEQWEAEESINRESEYIKKVAHHRQFAKEVRIFSLANFIIEKLNGLFIQKYGVFKKANGRYWRLKYIVHVANTILFTPVLLSYIGFKVLSGALSLGSFTVLFTTAFSISGGLAAMIMHAEKISFESEYYVTKLRKMLELESQIEAFEEGVDIEEIESIEFQHVSFTYPNHTRVILNDVSFQIEKGNKIALVGKNGAGKSTIVKLLLRLYDVTDGEILINGTSIKKYNIRSLRNCFSAVLQDYQIMDFSIRDNLTLGQNISDEEIKGALSFVELSERIDKCNAGIETFIGREFEPNGENFSGGECQKLAIARGFLRNCSCCIFDEANSSLDPFAEAAINKKLMEKNDGNIMIMVTHRLTAAVSASGIIHIEDGKVIGVGDHLSLMDTDPLYHEMFLSQAKLYEVQRDNVQYE